MPNLFGLNIAKIINDAIQSAGGLRPGTLTKVTPGTRTPGSLTGGTNPTTTTHSCSCYVTLDSEIRRAGQVGARKNPQVLILGASVSPTAVPEVNDRIAIDGITYTLIAAIGKDPSGSTYEFEADA
jgi:hypothetical protein